jgi:hypothetical protein
MELPGKTAVSAIAIHLSHRHDKCTMLEPWCTNVMRSRIETMKEAA